MSRMTLVAAPRMVLTNGQVTGCEIFLADGEDPSTYVQIPEAEFMATIEGLGFPNREQTEIKFEEE